MNALRTETLYRNHNGSVGYWKITAAANDSEGYLEIEFARSADAKAVTKKHPVKRKNIGRSNETSFAEQAALELESRVKKQLDKGYVRTKDEASVPVTNSLGLKKPMLAHPINKVKPEIIDWTKALAQPKLDGHRCIADGILYSRNGKEIALPHIRDWLGDHGLLDLGLDGELYLHGESLQNIGSLIKKPREESEQLIYHVYDIISDAPYEERYQELSDLIPASSALPVQLVPSFGVNSHAELDAMHKQFLAEGYEGTILRHGKTGYEDNKRSRSLLKVKDFQDTEFTVIDVQEGVPNGDWRVPVWVCSNPNGTTANAKTFSVTAAGTMQEKHDQMEKAGDYIGRSLTVQHFGHSKDMVPLLPVALRWREDV